MCFAVCRNIRHAQSGQGLLGQVGYIVGCRLFGQCVHPIGQCTLLVSVVEVERERSGQIRTTRFAERDLRRVNGREARDSGGCRKLGGGPFGEIDFPVMGRLLRLDDNVLVEIHFGVKGNSRHRVFVGGVPGDVMDIQLSVRILVLHMHGDGVVCFITLYRFYRSREGIYFRFVRSDNKLLLRFDYFGDTAYRVELNVIQRKVITDIQCTGIKVDNGYADVVVIRFGRIGLGALVPQVIAVLGQTQIQYLR